MSSARCDQCVFHADQPLFRIPRYLIHPEHGEPRVWDVRGEPVCPACSTRWRSQRDSTVEIVT